VPTVIETVVAAVLQSKVPVYADAVSVDVILQLSVTETVGATGVVFGDAVPDPGRLTQPLTVWVTVYVPAEPTVIDVVVAPVLHNNEPVKAEAESVDVPLQLLTTDTVGAVGTVLGEAVPEPFELTQPFTVCVTV
jgi:hypothetical protein